MANRNSTTASLRPNQPGRFARLPVDVLRVIAAQYTFEDRERTSEKGLDGIEVTALNQRVFGSICAAACDALEDVCVHATGVEHVDAMISCFEETPERARVVHGLSIESEAERYDENWLARVMRALPSINLLQLTVNLEPAAITPEVVAQVSHDCIQRLSIEAPIPVERPQGWHWGAPWRSGARLAKLDAHGKAIELATSASYDINGLLALCTLFEVARVVTDAPHEVFVDDTPPDIFDALISYTGPVSDLAALIQVFPNLQILDAQCFDGRIENAMSAIARAPRLRVAKLSIGSNSPLLISDIQGQLDVFSFQPGLKLWFNGVPLGSGYDRLACMTAYKKRGVNLIIT